MGNISEIIAVPCDECGGAGFLFWGDETKSLKTLSFIQMR